MLNHTFIPSLHFLDFWDQCFTAFSTVFCCALQMILSQVLQMQFQKIFIDFTILATFCAMFHLFATELQQVVLQSRKMCESGWHKQWLQIQNAGSGQLESCQGCLTLKSGMLVPINSFQVMNSYDIGHTNSYITMKCQAWLWAMHAHVWTFLQFFIHPANRKRVSKQVQLRL